MNTKPIEEIAKAVSPKLKELAKQYAAKLWDDIKSGKIDVKEKAKHLLYPELAKATVIPIEVDYLTKDKVIDTIKENKVPNADEVAVLLRKDKKKIYLYTGFLKDNELMPVEENKYIIFTADAIARDLESLFDNNELIVLN